MCDVQNVHVKLYSVYTWSCFWCTQCTYIVVVMYVIVLSSTTTILFWFTPPHMSTMTLSLTRVYAWFNNVFRCMVGHHKNTVTRYTQFIILCCTHTDIPSHTLTRTWRYNTTQGNNMHIYQVPDGHNIQTYKSEDNLCD